MTVYVDDMRMQARVGRINARWSHLTADTDEELHEFAARIGMRRSWFQKSRTRPEANHYDVTDVRRDDAIRLGAVQETMREGAIRRRARGKERVLLAGRQVGCSTAEHPTGFAFPFSPAAPGDGPDTQGSAS